MKIVVSNDITVLNAPMEVKKWAESNLVIDNPDFEKKLRLGKWIGKTPETISLYEQFGDDLVLPFGCLKRLFKFVRTLGVGIEWQTLFDPLCKNEYQSNISPYPYQEKAIEAILAAKNGIVVMPCGSGKTQTALEAVARIGGRALWLTHTSDLLNQSRERAIDTLGVNSADAFGTITDGKVKIGTHITFATVQTMCKLDLNKYNRLFDVVIVDECHHCCGSPTKVTQFYKVISALAARYKIGLTATPKRADGLERAMFALLGDVVYEVPKEEVKATTCPIFVYPIATNYSPSPFADVYNGDGTINYAALVKDLINDGARFEKIMYHLVGRTSCIVLANRVEYLQRLNKEFQNRGLGKSICLSGSNSAEAKRQRKEALKKLDCGELDCVFATYQLAKEGLDVPSLRYLMLATPEKDETTITQAVGRVGRASAGKKYGKVFDFVDDFGLYKGWAKKRDKYYAKLDVINLIKNPYPEHLELE